MQDNEPKLLFFWILIDIINIKEKSKETEKDYYITYSDIDDVHHAFGLQW